MQPPASYRCFWPIFILIVPLLYAGCGSASEERPLGEVTAGTEIAEISYLGSTLWTGVNDIDLAEGYAFCAYYNGLVVLSLADPSAPRLVSLLRLPGSALDLTVSEGIAYVADGHAGLQVVDLSDPAAPRRIGAYASAGYVTSVWVEGDFAYLIDRDRGLIVLDVSEPTSPIRVGEYTDLECPAAVAVREGIAYVASCGLSLLDVADPSDPREIGGLRLPVRVNRLLVRERLAYLATDVGIKVVNLADESQPIVSGSYNTPEPVLGLHVAGTHLYLANGKAGVTVLSLANPLSPGFAGNYPTASAANQITGDPEVSPYLYVADEVTRIDVLSVEEPAHPREVGRHDIPSVVQDVAVLGNHAFVANFTDGLQVIDIEDPNDPRPVTRIDTEGEAVEVAIEGTTLYLADGSNGLLIFDLSDPLDPSPAGHFATHEPVERIAVSAGVAYVTGLDHLFLLDVTHPESPSILSDYRNEDGAFLSLLVSGDLLFLADEGGELLVLDVSNPAYPRRVGGIDTGGLVAGIARAGNDLYLADFTKGLRIFDVTEPKTPTPVAEVEIPGAWDVALHHGFAYVIDRDRGLSVIRVADPLHPEQVASFVTPAHGLGLTIENGLVLLADYASLFLVSAK